MTPFYDVYSTLVYAASARDVRTTIIQGKVIMEDRRIRTIGVDEVRLRMGSTGSEDLRLGGAGR